MSRAQIIPARLGAAIDCHMRRLRHLPIPRYRAVVYVLSSGCGGYGGKANGSHEQVLSVTPFCRGSVARKLSPFRSG